MPRLPLQMASSGARFYGATIIAVIGLVACFSLALSVHLSASELSSKYLPPTWLPSDLTYVTAAAGCESLLLAVNLLLTHLSHPLPSNTDQRSCSVRFACTLDLLLALTVSLTGPWQNFCSNYLTIS